ncbi:helix-turn-helix domain-containing protein [Massilia sp.]|uniref:helix-turn-helix domain-containing protein n=1 Tax=Massilia sp. TaxID=1882437 RepID=UPI00352C034C
MKNLETQAGANSGVAMTAEAAAASHLTDLRNIRRSRLEILIEQAYGGSAVAFSNSTGFSEAQVSQFLSTTYREGRSLGERAARNIEAKAGLQFGWLDRVDSEARIPASLMPMERDAQFGASPVPAKAGTQAVSHKALGDATHGMIMDIVGRLPTIVRPDPVPAPEFTFDQAELQPGELYAGIVRDGGIYRHLILLPAEARAVTWQQAKTFAAAVGGELPNIDDHDVLWQNLRDQFSGEDTFWSSEWLNREEALYLDFCDEPFRDWDSVDSPNRARVVRRLFAGFEQSVVVNWPKYIKAAREAAGVPRERLSELTGVPLEEIIKWETGQERAVQGPDLANVCSVLNLDANWLLGADDE